MPDSTKIEFNFETLKFENITICKVKFWEEAFPNVDVIDCILKRMPVWLDSNPTKAHKKNWSRFITGWLSRQEERYRERYQSFGKE